MRYRPIGGTGLMASEFGFGAWTIGSDWWGHIDDDQARRMLNHAFDLGVNFYDTADQYGEGRSERLIGETFAGRRDKVLIAGKFGYDFYAGHRREGHNELPQNFAPEFVRFALERSLRRLQTDYLDIWHIHNARMESLRDDRLWQTLADLRREGKVRHLAVALGPAIGWLDEGLAALRERPIAAMQIIYNLLEQEPGRSFVPDAVKRNIGLLVRVPHSSGLLEGKFTLETTFGPNDHRSHRKREWLVDGLTKLEQLRFLTDDGSRTIGQAALQWLYAQPQVFSVLPNLYGMEQIEEFAAASDAPPLSEEQVNRVNKLFATNYGLATASASA
ncbi:MAG TPA: aldo/keto reductase [Dehalococcoidia bacterium]|nr:aldo/keto reductase [Dehalococcoidia bacterium]